MKFLGECPPIKLIQIIADISEYLQLQKFD